MNKETDNRDGDPLDSRQDEQDLDDSKAAKVLLATSGEKGMGELQSETLDSELRQNLEMLALLEATVGKNPAAGTRILHVRPLALLAAVLILSFVVWWAVKDASNRSPGSRTVAEVEEMNDSKGDLPKATPLFLQASRVKKEWNNRKRSFQSSRSSPRRASRVGKAKAPIPLWSRRQEFLASSFSSEKK